MPVPIFVTLIRRASGSAPVPSDLLTAIAQRLLDTPALTSLLGSATNVFDELAGKDAEMPFVVIQGYEEQHPGESLEDETVPADVWIYSNSGLATARLLGQIVRDTLDTKTINANATMTSPLSFSRGTCTGLQRNTTRPYRKPGLGRNGQPVYVECIQYEFNINPEL